MPALPSSVSFTDSGITEAQFKTAITNQREFLAGLLGTTGNQIDALVTLGALGADTVSKTSAYTVISTDRGKVILCNGTFTLSLTAAATLADGFNFAVVNTGTGVITIDPNSTETIDGELTKELPASQSVIIVSNGSLFYTMGGSGNAVSGLNVEYFTSNTTWTVPSGVKKLFVKVAGGGGAGGSAQYSGSRGGRGGSGGIATVYLTSLSSAYSINIGLGGVAVAGAHGTYNTAGASSSFGSVVTCNGGTGGQNIGTGVTGANGTAGSVTVGSGTRTEAFIPDPFGTSYGSGGAGAINPGTATNVVGTSGSDGFVAVFY